MYCLLYNKGTPTPLFINRIPMFTIVVCVICVSKNLIIIVFMFRIALARRTIDSSLISFWMDVNILPYFLYLIKVLFGLQSLYYFFKYSFNPRLFYPLLGRDMALLMEYSLYSFLSIFTVLFTLTFFFFLCIHSIMIYKDLNNIEFFHETKLEKIIKKSGKSRKYLKYFDGTWWKLIIPF